MDSKSLLIGLLAISCSGSDDAAGPPVIDSLTPSALCDRRELGVEEHVTVFGSNFAPGVRVEFAANGTRRPATFLSSADAIVVFTESIAAPSDLGLPIMYDLHVTNPDGQVATLPSALTYYGTFRLTDVQPRSAPSRGSVLLTVTGENFAGVLGIELGSRPLVSVDSSEVEVVSDTQARGGLTLLNTAVRSGVYPISVRNAGHCRETLDSVFTVE